MHNVKSLTDREHVLHRPAMYIGSVTSTNAHEYVLEDGKMQYREVSYVPGFIKIINEIIDNSVDEAIKSEFTSGTQIAVNMTPEYVEVRDNGRGIPVVQNDNGDYIPALCWNQARTGSNFDDDENRTQIGMNGVGSFSTNCFSTSFTGISDDGKKKYTVNFKDNASSYDEHVNKSSGKTGVQVKFCPDLSKFNLTTIDETHMNVIKQRLINLSMSFPDITFKFNGKKINVSSFKKYVNLFSGVSEIYETEDYKFAILPNSEDDFRQFSYVNGLKIPDGGTHIDVINYQVINGLRDKLAKRYKSIKPGDIKNKLMVIAFLKNVKNTKFNSQAKEKITNSIAEINRYYGKIPYDTIINKIFKTPGIIDPITEVYRIKEEFKKRQELKALGKTVKKFKSEKYTPSIGVKKYLVLTEGACLHEDTQIMMGDYTTKKIRDVDIGDTIISGDLTKQLVQAKVKLLKDTLTFGSSSGEIVCGRKHKLKVYDTVTQEFSYETAENIKLKLDRYKLVKSKINSETMSLKVISNDTSKMILETRGGFITYTHDDNFAIVRNGNIKYVHSTKIRVNDLILMS